MCGIVALCYSTESPRLGHEAAELLKRLEYRGYDSTGAAFIREDRSIHLLKQVGAPSRVVVDLGEMAKVEQEPRTEGRMMTMLLAPQVKKV